MILLCCARCGHGPRAAPDTNGTEYPAHAPAPDIQQAVPDLTEDERLPRQPDAGTRPDTFRAPTLRCRARRRVRGVPSELSILRRRSLAHLETIDPQRSIQHRHGPRERSLGDRRVAAGGVSRGVDFGRNVFNGDQLLHKEAVDRTFLDHRLRVEPWLVEVGALLHRNLRHALARTVVVGEDEAVC